MNGVLTPLYFTHDKDRTEILTFAYAPNPSDKLVSLHMRATPYEQKANTAPPPKKESKNFGPEVRRKNVNRAAWAEADSSEKSAEMCKKANIHVAKERKAKDGSVKNESEKESGKKGKRKDVEGTENVGKRGRGQEKVIVKEEIDEKRGRSKRGKEKKEKIIKDDWEKVEKEKEEEEGEKKEKDGTERGIQIYTVEKEEERELHSQREKRGKQKKKRYEDWTVDEFIKS